MFVRVGAKPPGDYMWFQETNASKKRLPRIHTELVRGGDIENYNRSQRGREFRKPFLLARDLGSHSYLELIK